MLSFGRDAVRSGLVAAMDAAGKTVNLISNNTCGR
jgi:hypothetical protein